MILVAGIASLYSSCARSSERDLAPFQVAFQPVVPLTALQAEAIIDAASLAVDSPNLIVAVVDRIGNPLALWHRNPAASVDDQNIALSIARTGAFMSSSQGPITSRTLEFISTFHYPPTFGAFIDVPFVVANPGVTTIAQQRATTGVDFTPQGPLWQIFSTNRGAPLALPAGSGAELTLNETGVETFFDVGQTIPPATQLDGTAPGPGLTYLPGGIPLYSAGSRVIGGVGCYITDPTTGNPQIEAMEFAALQAASATGFAAAGVPDEGAIFLVGVLLPYVDQSQRPAGVGTGVSSTLGGTFEDVDPVTGGAQLSQAGVADPFGDLITPRADPLGNFTQAEVERIRDQCINGANQTRAAIRLPIGTSARMVIAITNLDGLILALHRMEDAPIFSIDVAVAKARNVVYFSSATVNPLDQIPGVPAGTAITNRTLGFVTQPNFPPGISNSSSIGPLYQSLAVANSDPNQYNRMANAPFSDGLQSGVVLFPGAAPLYDSNGVLIGGLGVSGDGVEQDDYVTAFGHSGFEAPESIRADQYGYEGVRLPYFKFPQTPGGN